LADRVIGDHQNCKYQPSKKFASTDQMVRHWIRSQRRKAKRKESRLERQENRKMIKAKRESKLLAKQFQEQQKTQSQSNKIVYANEQIQTEPNILRQTTGDHAKNTAKKSSNKFHEDNGDHVQPKEASSDILKQHALNYKVKDLMDMGFPQSLSKAALKKANNDWTKALNVCIQETSLHQSQQKMIVNEPQAPKNFAPLQLVLQ